MAKLLFVKREAGRTAAPPWTAAEADGGLYQQTLILCAEKAELCLFYQFIFWRKCCIIPSLTAKKKARADKPHIYAIFWLSMEFLKCSTLTLFHGNVITLHINHPLLAIILILGSIAWIFCNGGWTFPFVSNSLWPVFLLYHVTNFHLYHSIVLPRTTRNNLVICVKYPVTKRFWELFLRFCCQTPEYQPYYKKQSCNFWIKFSPHAVFNGFSSFLLSNSRQTPE